MINIAKNLKALRKAKKYSQEYVSAETGITRSSYSGYENKVAELNDILEDLWNITNGRYTPNVVTSVPTIAGSEGDMKLYYSGSTFRIYAYLNGSWRKWDND